jgi:hypothetical protein
MDHADWRSVPRAQLQQRLDEWMQSSVRVVVVDPIMTRLGCVMSTSRRRNGDGQIKIRRHGTRQWAPRPWQVDGFLRGVNIDSLDGSHLCGMGLRGCCNPAHIHWEAHAINIARKPCTQYTTCPCPCRITHPMRPCPGHGDGVPRCIQADPFVEPNVQL